MKRIAITFLVFVIAACAGGPGVKLEAPAGDPESAANDQTEAAVVATEAPTSQPEEILPGIEVVPISEMAKEIPWLDTDIKAVPITRLSVKRSVSQLTAKGSLMAKKAAEVPHQCQQPHLSRRRCWGGIYIALSD